MQTVCESTLCFDYDRRVTTLEEAGAWHQAGSQYNSRDSRKSLSSRLRNDYVSRVRREDTVHRGTCKYSTLSKLNAERESPRPRSRDNLSSPSASRSTIKNKPSFPPRSHTISHAVVPVLEYAWPGCSPIGQPVDDTVDKTQNVASHKDTIQFKIISYTCCILQEYHLQPKATQHRKTQAGEVLAEESSAPHVHQHHHQQRQRHTKKKRKKRYSKPLDWWTSSLPA